MIMLKHWLLMWVWVNKHRRVGRPQNNPNQKNVELLSLLQKRPESASSRLRLLNKQELKIIGRVQQHAISLSNVNNVGKVDPDNGKAEHGWFNLRRRRSKQGAFGSHLYKSPHRAAGSTPHLSRMFD
jgi:hypothetical protein